MRHPWRLASVSLLASALTAASFGVWQGRAADPAPADPASQIDDPSVTTQLNALNGQVAGKQAAIQDLGAKIKAYQLVISQKEAEASSLSDEIALLDNRAEAAQLSVDENQAELDAADEQLTILDTQITALDAQLARDKTLIENILQEMNTTEGNVLLKALFSSKSIAELFNQLEYLQTVNDDLSQALDHAKVTYAAATTSRLEETAKRTQIQDLQAQLEANKAALEDEKGSKQQLLALSRNSEAQYKSFLNDSRQEEADVEHQVALLQGQIETKLKNGDTAGNSSLMSWPVDPSYRGLSTLFHDPTYPFRNLFPHSGIDIPQPQGTPVGAAAPGYVAWTRLGAQYGNYVMVIHENGLATLYAHLSKILVKQDQYVSRGDTIALSGGTPGIPGSGFSTGAHVHFEVRKDGIPVDPLPYMISKP
jgi:murein DD-endopeptidase MepM/ murein hydrolase activator NlpD